MKLLNKFNPLNVPTHKFSIESCVLTDTYFDVNCKVIHRVVAEISNENVGGGKAYSISPLIDQVFLGFLCMEDVSCDADETLNRYVLGPNAST
jgi:hypothetical protein